MTSMVRLPISKDALAGSIAGSHWILEKWEKLINEGIPGFDREAKPAEIEAFFAQLLGELTLVSRQCETIVDILSRPELV